jgi:drug/metabolite transporter (DMT)-like permease
MDHRTQGLALIILMIVLSVIFQVQLKVFANTLAALPKEPGWREAIAALVGASISWRGLVIIVLAGALFLLWLGTLTRLELSVAVPIASIALVITTVGGGLWLGESLTWMRIAGVVATAAGIGLVMSS